ncbi:MAG TPA: hypothetical protein VIB11_05955 [Pedococcus sp.]|jgi:hypothetical protein|uniref:hypothetical protein n=1 Tax=Pedococcus sp. TaxID=2860345 RepID=UPI002F9377B4
MVALIVGMLLCVVLALAVVALVAIPARREGRQVLTPLGEEVVSSAKELTQDALERTGEAIIATKDKVADSVGSSRDDETSADETGAPDTAPASAGQVPSGPPPSAAPAQPTGSATQAATPTTGPTVRKAS